MSFFSDLFSGNFAAVEHDISASVAKLPTWAQSLVTTLETDAGQILSGLVSTAATDLLSKGLTTANFTATAKDVESQLVSQGLALGTQTVYAALNAAVAEVAAPVEAPAPVDAPSPETPAAE